MKIKFPWEYFVWSVHNWHKVQSIQSWDKILVYCWSCRSLTMKTRKALQYKWCWNCRNKNKRLSYIYWIWAQTISKQLSRWWTYNQILWLEPRKIPSESFWIRDCKYLADSLESYSIEAKQIASNARYKFKQTPKWNIRLLKWKMSKRS